jgi:hypothetical protein
VQCLNLRYCVLCADETPVIPPIQEIRSLSALVGATTLQAVKSFAILCLKLNCLQHTGEQVAYHLGSYHDMLCAHKVIVGVVLHTCCAAVQEYCLDLENLFFNFELMKRPHASNEIDKLARNYTINDIFTSASSSLPAKLCTLQPGPMTMSNNKYLMFKYIVLLIDTCCARFLHCVNLNTTDDACVDGMDDLVHNREEGTWLTRVPARNWAFVCHSSSHLLVMDHHQFALPAGVMICVTALIDFCNPTQVTLDTWLKSKETGDVPQRASCQMQTPRAQWTRNNAWVWTHKCITVLETLWKPTGQSARLKGLRELCGA